MSSAVMQRVGSLSVVRFPAARLGLYVAQLAGDHVAPVGPDEILSLAGASAALDGPMFGVCDGHGYATTRCERLAYGYFDAAAGINVPSQMPGHGMTVSVVGGRAVATVGEQVSPGAFVAVQFYPPLVWQGQNVASRDIDANVTWRAGLAIMGDGSLVFAVMDASMYDFADALVGVGVTYAGYTDGGGSAALVTSDGVAGSSEGRRVASWLVVRGSSSALVLEALSMAGLVGVGAWLATRKW